jgi:NAD(P)-dependent dehydrogenase (short-subunit alcohol dehydrogenase family)
MGDAVSVHVAIVAGAGGGLGHAVTAALAAGGCTVVAVDRNEHALGELPGDVRREVADTADPAVAGRLVDRIAGEVGPPGVLVNTIGAFRPGDALSTTPEILRLMIDVNLGPALWLSQAVAPHMQRQGSGVIVHVAARPGIEPAGGMAAYSVSKAALVHLTRTLDIELRPHGIRVNAVAPQLLDTPANRAVFPAEVMAHAVTPEAIAGVIAFLVSDAAAPVSGAILPAYGA